MNNKSLTKKKLLLILTTITTVIYILWRIFFTIPFERGIVSLIAGIALLLAETIGAIEAFSHYKNLSSIKYPKLPKIEEDLYPEVDVFVATHSESVELLYKTINGCINMDYPDKSKVHVYICDDSNRSEMRKLAESLKIGYLGLSDNKDAKAGNINNAIKNTNSPLIVTFDADMIPRRDFLMETVPYFFLKDSNGEYEKVGFIQTPQSFYNPDLFQFNLYLENNIPNEQDYFFKEVNIGRNRTNTPIYAGSNTVISRRALEDVGGITTGTITEDFATGIKIQAKGYKCYSIPKVLANGLAPNDFKSLIKQRQRWGRGCVQTIRNKDFLFSDLSLRGKLSYVTCLLYWWTFLRRFIYILSPILFIVFGIVVVECSLKEILFIWLPSYILYNMSLRILSSNIRNQKWSNIVDTIIFPYMIIPIFLESIGIRLNKFAVTPKNSLIKRNSEIKYAIPHFILIITSLIALVFCFNDVVINKNVGSIVLLYWLVLNLYFLIMAVFFMIGRINFRDEERFYSNINVKILLDENEIEGIISDISENGMAIILDKPEYIPYDKETCIKIEYIGESIIVKGNILHVDKVNNKWKYGIKISFDSNSYDAVDDDIRMKYYHLVYDREHSLPKNLTSTTIKELYNNIIRRNKNNKLSKRKLPRLEINKIIKDLNTNEDIEVINYNYEYILIKNTGKEKNELLINLGEIINDETSNNIIMKCEIFKKNKLGILYKTYPGTICSER